MAYQLPSVIYYSDDLYITKNCGLSATGKWKFDFFQSLNHVDFKQQFLMKNCYYIVPRPSSAFLHTYLVFQHLQLLFQIPRIEHLEKGHHLLVGNHSKVPHTFLMLTQTVFEPIGQMGLNHSYCKSQSFYRVSLLGVDSLWVFFWQIVGHSSRFVLF